MAERAGAGAAPYEAEHRRLLTAVRDGSIDAGHQHSEVELAAAAGLTLEQVRAALVRLEYQGLVRRVRPDAVVVVTELRPEDWATGGQALALFVETSLRSTVPHLDQDEIDEYRALATTAADAVRLRSDTVGPAVLATLEFWGDHGCLPLVNRFMRASLEVHRYGLEALPPWQVWDTSGWLTASLHAAVTRDADAAQMAGHLLQELWERQEEASARFLGLPADSLRSLRGDAADPAAPVDGAPPLVASERGDERWWTLLGALRDGTFAPDVVHTLDAVAAVTGQSESDLRLAVRQLDAMGLIALQPGGQSAFTVRTPTLDDWADTVRMLVGVSEAGLRLLVPTRSAEDVAIGRAQAALVRRYAASRDPRTTTALTDIARFIVDRTPNRFVRGALLVCLSRTFLVLEPAPTFRRWDLDVFLRRFEDALEHGDPDAAAEAGHALARLVDAHIADVRAEHAAAERAKMAG